MYYKARNQQRTGFNCLFIMFNFLQGGPGSSSCGYGNFMEIGPLDVNLNPRNETWVNIVYKILLTEKVIPFLPVNNNNKGI